MGLLLNAKQWLTGGLSVLSVKVNNITASRAGKICGPSLKLGSILSVEGAQICGVGLAHLKLQER